METLTAEQRLDILTTSPDLPLGQLCRRLGYKPVTVQELEERFAVHALAAKYNSLEEARVINTLADKYKIGSAAAIKRFSVSLSNGEFTDNEERARLMDGSARMWFVGMGQHPIRAKFCTGMVKVEPIATYIGDDIPDRVLQNLDIAKAAGLTDFQVAYPVIEVKEVTVTQRQERDPVLLAKLGDRYLEIDMWE